MFPALGASVSDLRHSASENQARYFSKTQVRQSAYTYIPIQTTKVSA